MSDLLNRLVSGESLSETEATDLFGVLVDEATPPALSGALLAALRAKGETADELRGLARAMRARAIAPDLGDVDGMIDIVGTGGDGAGTFNLSTGSALLAAAAGARIVKHGNNAVSSRSGSADVLGALGLTLPLNERQARSLLERTNFTFLHAPAHHPALRTVGPVRRALGCRTVFNILGPLCHPAAPPFGVIGAFSEAVAGLMAEALSGLSIERYYVIHGCNGWDEATPVCPFVVFDVRPGRVERTQHDPREWGIERCEESALIGGDASHNAAALRTVFEGQRSAHRDALVLGAALALEVSGLQPDPVDSAARVAEAIDSGAALTVLKGLAVNG